MDECDAQAAAVPSLAASGMAGDLPARYRLERCVITSMAIPWHRMPQLCGGIVHRYVEIGAREEAETSGCGGAAGRPATEARVVS
jgi:hypothetical protein